MNFNLLVPYIAELEPTDTHAYTGSTPELKTIALGLILAFTFPYIVTGVDKN